MLKVSSMCFGVCDGGCGEVCGLAALALDGWLGSGPDRHWSGLVGSRRFFDSNLIHVIDAIIAVRAIGVGLATRTSGALSNCMAERDSIVAAEKPGCRQPQYNQDFRSEGQGPLKAARGHCQHERDLGFPENPPLLAPRCTVFDEIIALRPPLKPTAGNKRPIKSFMIRRIM